MESLFYFATPYTLYPAGTAAAYRMACKEAGLLIKAGAVVFSPIAHSHPISMYGGIPADDWQLWMRQCRSILPRCSGLIALKAPSWMHSRGMAEEIVLMEELRRPVFYMTLGEVPRELLKRLEAPAK